MTQAPSTEIKTFASIANALRKGIGLSATIKTDGFILATPVLDAEKRGGAVYVRTHEAGWVPVGDHYSTGSAFRRRTVTVTKDR